VVQPVWFISAQDKKSGMECLASLLPDKRGRIAVEETANIAKFA